MQVYIKFFAILSCLLCAPYIYAEDGEIPVAEKLDNIELAREETDELSRVTNCEKEIQNLTGRVELLEHAIAEIKKNNKNTDLPAVHANISPANTAIDTTTIPTEHNEKEKRDYDTALAALKESHFAEAENMFSNFIQTYPQSSLLSNANFWHAETFYRRAEFDKAAMYYLKGYKQFPKSPKAADSLLKLALSLGEIKKTKDACAILSKLDEEFKQRPASSIKRAYDARMKYGCK